MAEEIQHAATVRGKKRFSFATYTGILSGSTRTFRDSGEAEIPANRRFSLGGQNNRLAGATRTFRDPQFQVDAFGAKITGTPPAQPPTRVGSVASAGNYSPVQQDEASKLPVTAAGKKPSAAAAGRRKSLQEWLTTKTNYSAVQTEQASELLAGGADKKDEATSHQECPGYDSRDGDGNSNDNKSNPVHESPRKFQPTHGDTRRLGGDRNADNHKQGHGSVADLPHSASSDGMNASEDQSPINEPAVAIDDGDIYASTPGDGVSQQVTFSSGTMGLTLDMSELTQPRQKHEDGEQYPASPCSGGILETSPRYGSLQVFRKKMAFHGINAQMYHTGWKGTFLPPRDIRLFMSDSRKQSVLYWRYKKKTRGRDGNSQLGAEDRMVIPLSSLANIGPAELYTSRSAGALSSWLPIPSSLRRTGDEADASKAGDQMGLDGDAEKACSRSGEAEAPVLALSYWAEGEPRWVGDRPKRLLVKPDSLDAFRRLTNGLRLCCLHFHNYSCPQDLEDIR